MDETNTNEAAGVTGESGDTSASTEIDLAALLGPEGEEGEAGKEAGGENGQAEDNAEGDEEAKTEKVDPETATHKLDNGREVTLRELKQSFVDFSQKSSRIDNEKRALVEQARVSVAQVAERYATQANLLSQQVLQFIAPGIDENVLARMAIEDPAQYHAARARLDAAQRLQQHIGAHASQLAQQAQQQRTQAQQESAQQRQQLLESEAQKLSGKKYWTPEYAARLTSYAVKHGIPKDVVESVPYAGFVEIARKAQLYDEAMAKTKGGKQLPTQPQITPGTTGKVNDVKQFRGLMDRARKTSDTTDIGRVLMKLL